MNLPLILSAAALAVTLPAATARDFGVSVSSKGRGAKIETDRGGTAYVGPRGVAAEGADGNRAAVGRRGAAWSGENSAGVVTRRGAVAVGDDTAVAVRRTTTVVAPAPLPAGYIRVVPAGYTRVVYRGYDCFFVGGIYYRPVIYGGTTVYVIVR